MDSSLDFQDGLPGGIWMRLLAAVMPAVSGEGMVTAVTGLTVLLPPLLLVLWWQWFRRRRSDETAARLHDRAVLADRALDSAPDGWFLWPRPDPVTATADGEEDDLLLAGGECSRRLAVILSLYAGQTSTIQDCLDALDDGEAARLRAALLLLRREGEGFRLTLLTRQQDAGDLRRWVQVRGLRLYDGEGAIRGDVLWVRDVTEEEAAARLAEDDARHWRQQAQQVQDVLNALPLPVWRRDADLRVVSGNRAFLQAVEVSGADSLQQTERELVTGSEARELRALASAARAAGEARAAPFHVVLNGARRLMDVREIPCASGDAGTVTVGLALDQTRAETLRLTLEQEAASHAAVLERLGTAIVIFGPDTRLRFHNTAFARLWGVDDSWLDTEEPTYSDVLDALRQRRKLPEVADFPAFKEQELSRFKSLLEPLEDLMHRPDGKTLRRVVAPHPLGGLLATYEDVTDRLALEASLKELVAVQRETIDHLQEAVAVFGANGRLRLSNPAFRALWAVSPDLAETAPLLADLTAALPEEYREAAAWQDVRALVTAPPSGRTLRQGRLSGGAGRWLDVTGVPLPDGAVLVIQLQAMSRLPAAEPTVLGLSAFLTGLAEELRAPLTTILGFSEILSAGYYGSLNSRQSDYVAGIADAARLAGQMTGAAADLLTLEQDVAALPADEAEIQPLLARVLSECREPFRQKGVTLHFDCDPQIGRAAAASEAVERAVQTMMLTALYFTPAEGQVTLAAQTDPEEGPGVVLLTVADTGIGLTDEEQAVIEDPFGTAGSLKASVLPLAGVRRLARLLGGDLEVVSVRGEGTTLHLRLPRRTE